MKNIIFVFKCLVVGLVLSACEKEAYKPADIEPTLTYRLYNPVYTSKLTDEAYEMYVYREVPQLTIYGAPEYAQCSVEPILNYVDTSNEQVYQFSFDRIVGVDDAASLILHHYVVMSYKDRTPKTDPLTGELFYLESSMTITDSNGGLISKYENIGILERTRYLDDTN